MDKWILKMETIFFEDRFDWALGVRQEAMELVRRRNIDLIYTTGPPHSVHFLGYYVKKNTGIPWVMDFRDPMTKHAPTAGLGRLKTFCEELKKKTLLFLYESMFIRKADRVITATEPITQDLKALHPQNSPKITTITNGFDEQDFIGVTPRNGERRRLTIVYTGRFWAHQSPFDFLEGAKLALKRNPKLKDEMRVFFIGDINPQHTKLLTSPELFGTVQILGAMPHRDAISYQLGGDVNLLIVTPSEEKGGSRIFTGKIFEYLRAGRPILAIVPKGITWELIELQNLGYTVHPTDHSGIAQAIIAIYEKWRNSDLESFQLSPKLLREYDRRNLTEKLVKIFHGCFS